jgi:hypothetical protein
MNEEFLKEFRETIDQAASRLLALTDEDAAGRPAPGKWSRKEIVGHLIDSAANNHARFVRAQAAADLIFDGYDQDAWVRVQRYQERPWADLVRLWHSYNLHLASVMASADRDSLRRQRTRHNLDAIAWRPLPSSQPATLEYFMRDYVEHLTHHLRQAGI